MKISIVSAYYNRKQQLINTLNSIKRSSHNDYEMIVVGMVSIGIAGYICSTAIRYIGGHFTSWEASK